VGASGRPLNLTVRFRMHRAFVLLFALFVALQGNAVLAQTKRDCVITINADGSCSAAGLHVPCREIGPKLRQAGIPTTASIRFSIDHTVSYDVVSATIESVSRAGFKLKIGFINTQPVR
jgi:hypothetical protein